MENRNGWEGAIPAAPKKLNGRRLARAQDQAREVLLISGGEAQERDLAEHERRIGVPHRKCSKASAAYQLIPRLQEMGLKAGLPAVWAKTQRKRVRRMLRREGWIIGAGRAGFY